MTSTTTLPPFLTKELIKQALKSYHNVKSADALTLNECEFKLSPANGEYFCSEIYKVDVEYIIYGNAKHNSFIVKAVLPEEAELGSNEEVMLNTVLPGMEKCMSGLDKIKLHPKCLVSEHKTKDIEFYVLENLNSLGYYCADRTKGLDLEQAKLLMQKTAIFHAASMIFAKQFPQVVNSLLGSPFQKGACDDMSQVITYGAFEYVSNTIKEWPSYDILSDKIRSVIPKYNSLVLEVVSSKNCKFHVINHGDLWVNNFLYKYDNHSEKPTDVIFIDFQNSFWGSCGFDIVWFFNSSLTLKVLKENRQQLIQTYYETLKQTLEKENYLKQEIPTVEDVLLEIKRCEFIGFYVNLCEFPFFALDKSKSHGIDSSVFKQPEKVKELRISLYGNPRVQETLKYTLKYFDEINVL